eukprot:CAMPEP_0170652884 /NCGR_PEP_ID=MMETSP0224-20130122/47126_1 /TAXON_ID=285029 /ORGANISM="Togula jolla, Strain CCCM 725" /LENGTH=656 /DNA_ID=CAMNT_0010984747 /DNA_START=1 /DNA_END=1971 /DNA_ORIENTATION=-
MHTGGEFAETRLFLQQTVQRIDEVGLSKATDGAGITAFNELYKGIVRASSGKVAAPEALLSDLEPKGTVLRFVIEIHEQKKMYRRKTASVIDMLLHVEAWLQSLKGDAELSAALQAGARAIALSALCAFSASMPPATPDPSPSLRPPAAAEPGVAVPPLRPQAAAPVPTHGLESAVPGSRVAMGDIQVGLELLKSSKARMESLGYAASNLDEACTAFEDFRKAVNKVVRSKTTEDDAVLEKLEPKGKILAFLTEFYERKRLYRARVSSTLAQLLDMESWASATQADPSVAAAVRELMAEVGGKMPMTTLSAIPAGLGLVNLRKAADSAAERGCIGALFVKVVAAHNLKKDPSSGYPDCYVRVTVGGQLRRTEIINDTFDPRWDAGPFVFDVESASSSVNFQVLDSNLRKDECLGELKLSVSEAASGPAPPLRRALENVSQGELEVELHFAAPGGSPDAAPGAAAGAVAPLAGRASPAVPVFEVGENLEYHSASASTWIACKIIEADPTRGVQINIKRGYWISSEEQQQKLRRPAVKAPVQRQRQRQRQLVAEALPWVAWVSIDPRKGSANFYPAAIAQRIENAFAAGERTLDLGDSFFGARVDFAPKLVQRTAKGSRDVRRVELERPDAEFRYFIVKGADWRVSDPPAPGAEERCA